MSKVPTPEEVKRVHKLVDLINKHYLELTTIAPDFVDVNLITSKEDRRKTEKLFYSSSLEKLVWEEDD